MEANFETVQWYVIHTRSNHEKHVAAHLSSRNVEHFLPLYNTVRVWSDRRVRQERPLFPGYLFVHTALRDRLPILQAPGVVRLVGPGNQPAALEANLIERLREGLAKVSAEPYPYLATGQRVQVCSGPLKGMEGILLRRKGGTRVVISIDLIQKSFVADVDLQDLLPAGRSRTSLRPDHVT